MKFLQSQSLAEISYRTAILLMFSVSAYGQQRGCPNDTELYRLCYSLEKRQASANPIGYNSYEYQDIVFRSACVSSADDRETRKSKISEMWKRYESQLVCDIMSFNVANGSIIKFAISSRFDQFIDNVIAWKVDLNGIDAADGRTVLDYAQSEIEIAQGLPSESKLKGYYRRLKLAGAKHREELAK